MFQALKHRILPLALSILSVCLLSQDASAQSSTRAIPPNVRVQGQPIYTPTQTIPSQGSPVRGVPLQGSTTRGQVIGGPHGTPTGSASNQGSARRDSIQPAAPVRPASFETKLWNYLIRSKYQNWAPVPGKSDAAYEGESPHGAYLKMYLNRKAAGSPNELPNGSIVIKENYSRLKTLAAITVMYKTKGYNPKAGDWYWVKYNTNGSVASKSTDNGEMRLSGRVGGCIECHGGADGDDFAFFND